MEKPKESTGLEMDAGLEQAPLDQQEAHRASPGTAQACAGRLDSMKPAEKVDEGGQRHTDRPPQRVPAATSHIRAKNRSLKNNGGDSGLGRPRRRGGSRATASTGVMRPKL